MYLYVAGEMECLHCSEMQGKYIFLTIMLFLGEFWQQVFRVCNFKKSVARVDEFIVPTKKISTIALFQEPKIFLPRSYFSQMARVMVDSVFTNSYAHPKKLMNWCDI